MIIYDRCQEEAFGEERLRQVVLAAARGRAQEVLWAITGALAGFVGKTEQAEGGTGVGDEVGVVKQDRYVAAVWLLIALELDIILKEMARPIVT